MWMALFRNCQSVSDRVLALRSMAYFKHPPEKKDILEPESYSKDQAFEDMMIKEKNYTREDLKIFELHGKRGGNKTKEGVSSKRPRTEKSDSKTKATKYDKNKYKEYKEETKRYMMAVRKERRNQIKEQNLHPDEGPVDIYIDCIDYNENM